MRSLKGGVMFQYTVVKDLCGGSIIKRRISEDFFLFFKECENIVIPLPFGIESLKEEDLGKTFEVLLSKDFDVSRKNLEQKKVVLLKWEKRFLVFIYKEIFIPEYGGIENSELINVFLIC